MNQFLRSSRFVIILAVIGALISAVTVLVYGLAEVVQLVIATVEAGSVSRSGAKALAIELIEVVDLFLLGTVFFIISVGLYELFIDPNVGLPPWLEIRTLDDLKNKLIGVVVVVLGVLFLGQIVAWDGERELLGYGAAIALVIAALTFFLGYKAAKPKAKTPDKEKDGA